MGKKKKSGPLYNYKSPRDYEVFNWGNEADPPFKLKSGNAPLFKHVGSSPLEEKKEISRKYYYEHKEKQIQLSRIEIRNLEKERELNNGNRKKSI